MFIYFILALLFIIIFFLFFCLVSLKFNLQCMYIQYILFRLFVIAYQYSTCEYAKTLRLIFFPAAFVSEIVRSISASYLDNSFNSPVYPLLHHISINIFSSDSSVKYIFSLIISCFISLFIYLVMVVMLDRLPQK